MDERILQVIFWELDFKFGPFCNDCKVNRLERQLEINGSICSESLVIFRKQKKLFQYY